MQRLIGREPSDMSWPRALILATGFFFVSAIYLGQIPSFFQLVFTQANLATMEQSMLSLGLLTVGIALIALTASMLYDPKPVSKLFVYVFLLLGLVLMALGIAAMAFVLFSGHEFFPDQTFKSLGGGNIKITNWPDPDHSWLFNPIWFQARSIDIGAVGMVAFFTGGGVFGYAALYPLYAAGRLTGALRSALVQFSAGIGVVLVLAYLTIYTFSPKATTQTWASGALENIALGLALSLVLFALQVWLLPVMTAPGNREKFMPNMYLHAVMLLQSVAAPLLLLFVAVYPVVYWLQSIDLNQGYWVQCAVKTSLPASCTFTPYIGYIVAGVVAGQLFTFLLAAGYLWNRKPGFVRLGMVFSFVFAGLAVAVTHVVVPAQTPIALVLAIGIAIVGLVWTMSTQREFVPAEARHVALGCTGQWLVMGTLLFIYLACFAFFSYPVFLDTEANLILVPGQNTIHDAYWVMIIMGVLAAIQFAFLIRRQSIGMIRKLTLWLILIGAGMQIAASIHFDLGNSANLVNWAYYTGVFIEVVGILIGAWGALQTRGSVFLGLSVATVVIGAVGAAAVWVSPAPHLWEAVVAFTILMSFGAIVYTIYGADAPDRLLARFQRGHLPAARAVGMPEE